MSRYVANLCSATISGYGNHGQQQSRRSHSLSSNEVSPLGVLERGLNSLDNGIGCPIRTFTAYFF